MDFSLEKVNMAENGGMIVFSNQEFVYICQI